MSRLRTSAHTLLLGHRGARAITTIPENTIRSFDRALADGCDGFEFDVRLSGDGEAVICHAPKFNGIEIAKALRQELQQLPLLNDVMVGYQDRAFLDIELKVAGLESLAVDLLGKYPTRRGFVVSSFLPELLSSLYRTDPTIPLGVICENRSQLSKWKQLPIEYVIPHYELVSRKLLEQLHAAAKKVLVWTVNHPARMRRLAAWGVEGIISDNPKLLADTLRP
jgi:glycerophosphoryl diester phosphodiesterase